MSHFNDVAKSRLDKVQLHLDILSKLVNDQDAAITEQLLSAQSVVSDLQTLLVKTQINSEYGYLK